MERDVEVSGECAEAGEQARLKARGISAERDRPRKPAADEDPAGLLLKARGAGEYGRSRDALSTEVRLFGRSRIESLPQERGEFVIAQAMCLRV